MISYKIYFLGYGFFYDVMAPYKLSMIRAICREQFEYMAQLNSSLKDCGLTEDLLMESTQLIDRYQTLLRQLCDSEEEVQLPSAEDQSFSDLAHDVIQWITEIKEALMVLNSSEGSMPLAERIQKIKVLLIFRG